MLNSNISNDTIRSRCFSSTSYDPPSGPDRNGRICQGTRPRLASNRSNDVSSPYPKTTLNSVPHGPSSEQSDFISPVTRTNKGSNGSDTLVVTTRPPGLSWVKSGSDPEPTVPTNWHAWPRLQVFTITGSSWSMPIGSMPVLHTGQVLPPWDFYTKTAITMP